MLLEALSQVTLPYSLFSLLPSYLKLQRDTSMCLPQRALSELGPLSLLMSARWNGGAPCISISSISASSAASAHHQQHQRISSISSITASSTSAFQQHQRISSISFSAHTYGSTGEQRCITQEVPASLKKQEQVTVIQWLAMHVEICILEQSSWSSGDLQPRQIGLDAAPFNLKSLEWGPDWTGGACRSRSKRNWE